MCVYCVSECVCHCTCAEEPSASITMPKDNFKGKQKNVFHAPGEFSARFAKISCPRCISDSSSSPWTTGGHMYLAPYTSQPYLFTHVCASYFLISILFLLG